MDQQKVNILLIEDNPAEARLTQEALKVWRTPLNVDVVNTGDDALNFLRKLENYKYAKRPDLIFLDLNLPKKHGREILAEIKSDPELKSIPVLILTVSESEDDVYMGYQLGTSGYIKKTFNFDHFIEMMRKIEDYWLSVVILPRNLNGLFE
ncbi:MAG: response regulator [Candidatus Omnitrophica bacterium]|nr:response regulator [Candidatus Omnitrophota bacterium]